MYERGAQLGRDPLNYGSQALLARNPSPAHIEILDEPWPGSSVTDSSSDHLRHPPDTLTPYRSYHGSPSSLLSVNPISRFRSQPAEEEYLIEISRLRSSQERDRITIRRLEAELQRVVRETEVSRSAWEEERQHLESAIARGEELIARGRQELGKRRQELAQAQLRLYQAEGSIHELQKLKGLLSVRDQPLRQGEQERTNLQREIEQLQAAQVQHRATEHALRLRKKELEELRTIRDQLASSKRLIDVQQQEVGESHRLRRELDTALARVRALESQRADARDLIAELRSSDRVP